MAASIVFDKHLIAKNIDIFLDKWTENVANRLAFFGEVCYYKYIPAKPCKSNLIRKDVCV